jgi:hypothetical protein
MDKISEDFLSPSVIADIVYTLFGIKITADEMANSRPDIFFGKGHRFDITLCFAHSVMPKELYRLDLSLPIGNITADAAGWEALMLRLAVRLSEMTEETYRPMSWEEMQDFYRRQDDDAAGKYFMLHGTTGDA